MAYGGVCTQRTHGMAPGVDRPSPGEASPTAPPPLRADGVQESEVGPTARRGTRTVVLSVVALVGLAALAVGTLFISLGPPERSGPATQSGAEASRTGPGPAPPVAEAPEISGTISMAPELRGRVSEGGTLFIIARKGPGPPFAVKRISGPRFPLTYRLGPEDVMAAGTPFEGELSLSARLSRTGAAGPAQRGDLEGEHPGRVTIGARGADIIIARVH
jgi:hypothetical protein